MGLSRIKSQIYQIKVKWAMIKLLSPCINGKQLKFFTLTLVRPLIFSLTIILYSHKDVWMSRQSGVSGQPVIVLFYSWKTIKGISPGGLSWYLSCLIPLKSDLEDKLHPHKIWRLHQTWRITSAAKFREWAVIQKNPDNPIQEDQTGNSAGV